MTKKNTKFKSIFKSLRGEERKLNNNRAATTIQNFKFGLEHYNINII